MKDNYAYQPRDAEGHGPPEDEQKQIEMIRLPAAMPFGMQQMPVHPITKLPVEVYAAAQFVSQCNEQMGLRCFTIKEKFTEDVYHDVREDELHPAQEHAFKAANAVLAGFFLSSECGQRGIKALKSDKVSDEGRPSGSGGKA